MNDSVNAILHVSDITDKTGVHQKPRFSALGEHFFGERLVNGQKTKHRNIKQLHGLRGERFGEHQVNNTPIVHQNPPYRGVGERGKVNDLKEKIMTDRQAKKSLTQ